MHFKFEFEIDGAARSCSLLQELMLHVLCKDESLSVEAVQAIIFCVSGTPDIRISLSSAYYHLECLVRQELAKREKKEGKNHYSISECGRKYLQERYWLNQRLEAA